MEFSKENILQNWFILNTSKEIKLKSTANSYLTLFKQSVNVIPICGELFKSATDQSIKFFSSLLIYQHIKENISNIAEEKEVFNKYKQFLFNAMIPTLQDCSEIVISNVCQSITVLVLVGKVTYWPESFDEILQFSSTSELNCKCAIMILGYFYKELNEMKIDIRLLIKIRVECIDSRDIVKTFIMNILRKISSDDNNAQEAVFKHLLDMTLSWIKFAMNILSIENYPLMLINSLNKDYRGKIVEVLSDCFQYSSISVTSFMSKYPNDLMHDILAHADKSELNIVYQIIMVINASITSYSSSTPNQNSEVTEDVLFQIATIFSSLCKNYVYLLFLPDKDTANVLWTLFFFFLSNRTRRVSYLLFESIEEMKNIINQHKFLESYTEEQNNTYKEYLFQINNAILSMAKLSSLDVNYGALEKKQNESKMNNNNHVDIAYIIEGDDDEVNDLDDITKLEYRNAAEDALSNIFLIFLYNFPDGIKIYLEQLGSLMLLPPINQSTAEVLNNKEYIKIAEVVLFNIRSIRYFFDLPGIDQNMLLNFSHFILNSQLIKNDRIMLNFIIFLDSIAQYVNKHSLLYQNSIQFLLSVIVKCRVIEKISALVILNIVDSARDFDIKIHDMLCQFYYKGVHDLFSNALSHLCECLLKSVIKAKNLFNKEDVIAFAIQLLEPVSVSLENNTLDHYSLMKTIEIYSTIIKTVGAFNKDVLNGLLKQSQFIFALCESVIAKYFNDNELLNSIIFLYVKICHYLKEHCLIFFYRINNVIFSIYSLSNETYEVMYIMKALYIEAIKDHSSSYCSEVTEKFCAICSLIHNAVCSILKNKLETIQQFASFVSLMLQHMKSFPMEFFDYNVMGKVMSMFIESNEGLVQIELNRNLIRLFSKVCSSKLIPMDFKRKYIDSFVRCCINNLEHYDISVVKDLSLLLIDARGVDIELFDKGIKQTLEQDISDLIQEYFGIFGGISFRNKIERLVMDLIDIKKRIKKNNALDVFHAELKAVKFQIMNQQ